MKRNTSPTDPIVLLLFNKALLRHVALLLADPNMEPRKNKACPKRPQFFLPGLLKVALLPGPSAPGAGGSRAQCVCSRRTFQEGAMIGLTISAEPSP